MTCTTGGWTNEQYKQNDTKNRKIVLRSLITAFKNIEDEINDEANELHNSRFFGWGSPGSKSACTP
jgi:hypothetical protein